MKTISSCFLYIAVVCPLTVINFLCLVADIVAGDWKGAIMVLFSLVAGIWVICNAYKRAKRIEESMKGDVCIIFKHKHTQPSEKDKTDEVETDK